MGAIVTTAGVLALTGILMTLLVSGLTHIANATKLQSAPGVPNLTATASPTPQSTPTPTPTSIPAPPTLIAPEDAALLPQPVPPDQWVFKWDACAPAIVCWSSVGIAGPGERHFGGGTYITTEGHYQYVYTSTDYLPVDALGPWYWSASAHKFAGSSRSETRTFWVMPPPWLNSKFWLPLILKDD